MIISVALESDESRITLEDPTVFDRFAVRVDGYDHRRHDLESLLAQVGSLVGSTRHVFVMPEMLRRMAGDYGVEPGWNAKFDRMVAYATERGWVSEDGAIRAHIETTPPRGVAPVAGTGD